MESALRQDPKRREAHPLPKPTFLIASLFVVTAVATSIVAAAAGAAALEAVELFVQAFEFLLSQIAFVFRLLESGDDAFEVAQD